MNEKKTTEDFSLSVCVLKQDREGGKTNEGALFLGTLGPNPNPKIRFTASGWV